MIKANGAGMQKWSWIIHMGPTWPHASLRAEKLSRLGAESEQWPPWRGQRDAICLSFKVEGNEPRSASRKLQKTLSSGPPGGTQPRWCLHSRQWDPAARNPIQNQMLLPVLRPVRVPFPAAPMGGTFIPLKYVTFQISYLQTPLNQPMRGQWPLLHIVT